MFKNYLVSVLFIILPFFIMLLVQFYDEKKRRPRIYNVLTIIYVVLAVLLNFAYALFYYLNIEEFVSLLFIITIVTSLAISLGFWFIYIFMKEDKE